MRCVILCFLVSSAVGLSLLDLNDGMPLRTYSQDNVQNNADGTVSFKEDPDYDTAFQNDRHSSSIPLIEAPVAMSNPIWKIVSRGSDIYRIIRRSRTSQDRQNSPSVFAKSRPPSLPRTLRESGWFF